MSARTEELLRQLAAVIREEVGALPANILTLAEEVKAARAHARMSLQEVASASGFTKSHIWEIENARAQNPTVNMVAGLAKALGVPFLRLAQAALNTATLRLGVGRDGAPLVAPDVSDTGPGTNKT